MSLSQVVSLESYSFRNLETEEGKNRGFSLLNMWLEGLDDVQKRQGFERAESGPEELEGSPEEKVSEGTWKCRGKCEGVLELNETNFHCVPSRISFRVACKVCVNEKRDNPVPRWFKTCNGGRGKVLRENEENFYRRLSRSKYLKMCKLCFDVRFGQDVCSGQQQCKGARRQVLPACAEFFYCDKKARSGFSS